MTTESPETHFIDEIGSEAPTDKFAWIEITNKCIVNYFDADIFI